MPKVRMPDGTFLDVGLDALYTDDGTNPLNIPTGPVFTADDIARARQEEKDKLYNKIDSLTETITSLNEKVGGLTAAEQREQARAEEERARLEAEARRQEEQNLDAATLVDRRAQEWQQQLQEVNSTWEQKFQEAEQQRLAAEAAAKKEREFGELRDYTLSVVEANKDKIAPQFLRFIGGNTKEEVDQRIQEAIQSTDEIAAEMQQALGGQQQIPGQPGVPQQQQPAPLPGVRPTGGPGNTDPSAQFQQLTADDIANMPMDQYAQLRGRMGIGGQSQNRGLFG